MRTRLALAAAILLLAYLQGCQGFGARWPWEKKDVPVTPPQMLASDATPGSRTPTPAPTTRATQPAELPVAVYWPARATAPATAPAEGKPPSETKLVAASVLQVNDRFITVEDVLRGAAARLAELPRSISEQSFREQAEKIIREEVRRQVTESLVYAEAQKRLTEEQKKEVDKEVAETERDMIASAGGSKARLEQDLAKEGTNLETVLKEHRLRAGNATYLRARFMPAVVVNHRMLMDYYRAHLSEFSAQKKVQMQVIGAPFKAFLAEGAGEPTPAELDAARLKAREHIGKAVEMLKSGTDFTEVAMRMNRGRAPNDEGVWPLMPAGSFGETKVEEAAFAIKEGQKRGVVTTDSGYYIVKALKVEDGKTIQFEDAQEAIEKRLRDEQYRKITEDYLRKLFVEGATIIESDKFLESALSRAVEKHWRTGRP
jgi:hypothetical protein